MTNYFVYPGEREDEDAKWLQGLAWRGVVRLEAEVGGEIFETDTFVLVPHSVLEG